MGGLCVKEVIWGEYWDFIWARRDWIFWRGVREIGVEVRVVEVDVAAGGGAELGFVVAAVTELVVDVGIGVVVVVVGFSNFLLDVINILLPSLIPYFPNKSSSLNRFP